MYIYNLIYIIIYIYILHIWSTGSLFMEVICCCQNVPFRLWARWERKYFFALQRAACQHAGLKLLQKRDQINVWSP